MGRRKVRAGDVWVHPETDTMLHVTAVWEDPEKKMDSIMVYDDGFAVGLEHQAGEPITDKLYECIRYVGKLDE